MTKPQGEMEEKTIKLIEEWCFTGDTEADHGKADEVLCLFLLSLGYDRLVQKYSEVKKWYA